MICFIFKQKKIGHGDFGGEVERILSMVDGVVLLVDATEVRNQIITSIEINETNHCAF